MRRFLRGILWSMIASSILASANAVAAVTSPLLLISLDGFRWDYCTKYPAQTPNLRRLKKEGASAHALISVFPSNTFADHYTIATGLWPEHHGIINNVMFDPRTGLYFHYNIASSVRASGWWGGEPIWITALKQGEASACYFWPGSEAEIEGLRPTYWKPYDYSIPFEKRVDETAAWLTGPGAKRPSVITFYLEETNSVGHAHGPDSPEMAAAIQLLDTRVGRLLERLAVEKIEPNVVVVSDHGMTSTRWENSFALEDYLDLSEVQLDFTGPVAGLRPIHGSVDQIMTRLKNLPNGARAYRSEELPLRFHLQSNPRIPPIWILPAEGGWADTRLHLAALHLRSRGEHGYDPELPSMGGLLIVHGPAFRNDGFELGEVQNIHLYNLFCAVLHLKPAANDGDDRLVRAFLKP